MTRRRFLIVVLVFLLIVLVALIAGFVAFQQYTAPPAAANAPGLVHVRTIYGWGSGASDVFVRPFGGVYRNGSLYVVDKDRSQVVQLTPTGELVRLYGSRGANPEQLQGPTGVEVDAQGNVYVSDGSAASRIVVYSPGGEYVKSVEMDAQPLAFAIAGSRMFVTTVESVKVLAMPELTELASWGTKGKGEDQFANPNGIAFDAESGTLYVSDGNNLRVKAMDEQGRLLWTYGRPPENMNDTSADRRFGLAGGLALAQGHLFVADPLDAVIHVLTIDGEEVAQVGDVGTADGQFEKPTMVVAMEGGEIAVMEWGNARVQILKLDPERAAEAWREQGNAPVPAANAGG